jgi:hypothetical protein
VLEPNELRSPGETGARERVEALFERIDELGPDIRRQPVPLVDVDEREVVLAELEALADRHGRGELLDEARQRVRDGLLKNESLGAIGAPFGIGIQPSASATADDQVARLMAVEDLISAAVVVDLVDERSAEARSIILLSAPGRRLLGLPVPDPEPGADEDAGLGDGQTDDTDAEADAIADAEAEAEARESQRQRRAVVFVAALAIALPIGVAIGTSLPGLVILALAALVLAWLFG